MENLIRNTIALSQNEMINLFGIYGGINAEVDMRLATPVTKDKRFKNSVRKLSEEKKVQLAF